ncbi:hypothetical protein [Actinophytocola sp.]|uniref:hypothetical protein n=1 Tax=Actinophytocola sp. TaxID=1872138 RepID=UPI002ED7A886
MLVGAVAVALVAPTAAEAAAANQNSSSPGDSANRGVQARQKAVPARSGPANSAAQQSSAGAPSPGFGRAPSSQPTQRKDKPPDRSAHKFSPQQRSSASHASPGSAPGSGPTTKVGADRPADRDPNKVTPQQRTPASPPRDNRHDRPGVSSVPPQGVPGRSGANGSATQQLVAWAPPKPKTAAKTGTHDLAYRYRIVAGRPGDPTVHPLDEDWNIWGIDIWDRDSFGGKFTSDILVGLWDGVTGTVDLLWRLSNPAEYAELLDEMAKIAAFAKDHPVEFAKQMVSWDQWQTEPGRALGNNAFGLIPAAGALSKLRTLRKLLEDTQVSKGPSGDGTPSPEAVQQPAPAQQPAPVREPAPVQQPAPHQPTPGEGPDASPGSPTPDRATSDSSSTAAVDRSAGPAERDTTQVPAAPAPRHVDNNGRPATAPVNRGRADTSQGRPTSPGQAPPRAGVVPGRGANSARPGDHKADRANRDIAVSPVAPRALSLNRSIGRPSHNQALKADIAALPRGATDVRVNQQQVNAIGQRVGINRPDLQYTLNGQRYYVEYEGLANPRGLLHEARILANDPGAIFLLRLIP